MIPELNMLAGLELLQGLGCWQESGNPVAGYRQAVMLKNSVGRSDGNDPTGGYQQIDSQSFGHVFRYQMKKWRFRRPSISLQPLMTNAAKKIGTWPNGRIGLAGSWFIVRGAG